jgi:hypothetical protein
MQVVYGYEMAPRDDLFASIADRASEMLTNSFFPGAALVNTFPMCMYHLSTGDSDSFDMQCNICRSGAQEQALKSESGGYLLIAIQ